MIRNRLTGTIDELHVLVTKPHLLCPIANFLQFLTISFHEKKTHKLHLFEKSTLPSKKCWHSILKVLSSCAVNQIEEMIPVGLYLPL